MIRKYSRPRTLTPGWTSPRRARARLACGLTTMPSPPLAVSSSHQATPAAVEPGSVGSTSRRRAVGLNQPGRGGRQPVSECEVPAVITVVVGGVLGGEDLEWGQADAVQAVGGPAVPPVGGRECVRVAGPAPHPVEQRRDV